MMAETRCTDRFHSRSMLPTEPGRPGVRSHRFREDAGVLSPAARPTAAACQPGLQSRRHLPHQRAGQPGTHNEDRLGVFIKLYPLISFHRIDAGPLRKWNFIIRMLACLQMLFVAFASDLPRASAAVGGSRVQSAHHRQSLPGSQEIWPTVQQEIW